MRVSDFMIEMRMINELSKTIQKFSLYFQQKIAELEKRIEELERTNQ